MSTKAGISFHDEIEEIRDVPYTISYVMRKRMQVDGLNELPRDKRPPDSIMWSNSTKHLDDWIDKVLYNKKSDKSKDTLLSISEIE